MNAEELFAQAHIVEQQIVELQPLQAEGIILDMRARTTDLGVMSPTG